jgi:hypothetical protein
MRVGIWFIIFGSLVLAGLADFASFSSLPGWLQAHDLSPIANTYGPTVLLIGKMVIVGGLALVVLATRRTVYGWLERAEALAIAGLASLWLLGAWTNIANAPAWINQ